ncbi:hypothetical protein [Ensifer sp. MJa1]|uniref:hypothetical protein n=1 Tax=Ensifer sp. MJa1 TaxID=2919888 RepID=UPI00300BA665
MLLFNNVKLGRDEFDRMAPALRTEAVLLAIEAGGKPVDIAEAVGRSVSEIFRAASEVHALRLSGSIDDDHPKCEGATTEVKGARLKTLSKTAQAILSLVAAAGDRGLPASTDTLARAVGVGPRHVNTSMNRLIADELVYRLRPPHGTAPTIWAATEGGKAVDAAAGGKAS